MDTLVTAIIASIHNWIERVMINDIDVDTSKGLSGEYLHVLLETETSPLNSLPLSADVSNGL